MEAAKGGMFGTLAALNNVRFNQANAKLETGGMIGGLANQVGKPLPKQNFLEALGEGLSGGFRNLMGSGKPADKNYFPPETIWGA